MSRRCEHASVLNAQRAPFTSPQGRDGGGGTKLAANGCDGSVDL